MNKKQGKVPDGRRDCKSFVWGFKRFIEKEILTLCS